MTNLSAYLNGLVLSFVLSLTASANNYYVDPSYSGGGPNGSLSKPWTNLSSVNSNMWSFVAGDTIFFKRGQHFTGTLDIYVSGTSLNPIVFMPYGSGVAPVIEYSLPDAKTPINRSIIAISNNRYVVVDGFMLIDATIGDAGHTSLANVGRGAYIYLGKHITLKNMEIEKVGIGITIQGDSNLVESCTISNLREIVNTVSPTNDDYGAVGILIAGSYNYILSNTITECWAASYDYTSDGGAIELVGNASENQILYNKAINNDGWAQIDTDWSGATESNNLMAYNLLINNGRIFWFNFGGTLTVQGLRFYNNDIVETVMQHSFYPYMIGCDAAPTNASALLVKNNIFWINTPIDITYTVSTPFSGTQMVHQNNLYHLSGGSLGYSVHSSETMLAGATTVFTNTTAADPALWDYHIPMASPAYDYGLNLSLNRDFEGTSVYYGTAPEAGMLETFLSPLANAALLLNATRKGRDNFLQWYLKTDKTNDEIISCVVEKSLDGKTFYRINELYSPKQEGRYSYIDLDGAKEKCYYRITLNLNGGNRIFSKIISTEGLPGIFIDAFPNPVSSNLYLMSFEKDLNGAMVSIFASNGNLVKQIRLKEGKNSVVPFDNLPSGSYILQVKMKDGKVFTKMIIKN